MSHSLLERQLRSLGLDREDPPTEDAWRAMLDRVSDAYAEADKARRLAEGALTVASSEMRGIYAEASNLRHAMIDELDTLNDVFHHIESGLCRLSHEGCVTLMNPAAERLLGWRESELLGQPVLDLFTTTSEGGDDNADTPGFVHPGVAFRELNGTLTRNDGDRVPIAYSLTPIGDGAATGAVLVFWDTAVQADSRDELLRAMHDAEAATEAKTDFLVSMSHEIRTPMNAVIGLTGLLGRTELDHEQRELATDIESSANSLLSILNDVLDYSRIESGVAVLAEEPYEVRACVEDVLDLFAIRAAEKGIELAYTQSESVPQVVVGDVNRLRQILTNLVSNAVKFTSEGQVVVDVRAMSPKAADDADPRVRLKITVRDTGCGIAPEHQERLFEAFNETPGTTRRLAGTGIGLAICKRLADLFGGTISVRSRGVEGKGTAFTFSIVARVSNDIAHMNDVAEVPDFANKHLLVVEDNDIVRGWLADQARSWGFQVTVATNAEDVRLLLAGDLPFALAFVDETLPGDDAGTIVDTLTKRPTPIPVVALARARELGTAGPDWLGVCAETIRKPVRLTEYWNTMAVLLMSELADAMFGDVMETPYEQTLAEALPLRILIAEDDSVNQRVIARMLEGFGYACDEANDGHEVLAAFGEKEYDLVMLDLMMPNLGGIETAEAIRETIEAARRPTLIAISASAREDERDRCLAAGMIEFLEKPIQIERLKEALISAHHANARRPDAAA